MGTSVVNSLFFKLWKISVTYTQYDMPKWEITNRDVMAATIRDQKLYHELICQQ